MNRHVIMGYSKGYRELEKAFASFTGALSELVSVSDSSLLSPSGGGSFSAFGHALKIEWRFVVIGNESMGELGARLDAPGTEPFLVLWFDTVMNIRTRPESVFSSFNGFDPAHLEKIVFMILEKFLSLDCFSPGQKP